MKQVGPGRYGFVQPPKPVSPELQDLIRSYVEESPDEPEEITAVEAPAAIGRNPRRPRSGEYSLVAPEVEVIHALRRCREGW